MKEISSYFNAEKFESFFFIAAGLIAIICSVWFLIKIRQPFYTGMAWPLIAVALLQLFVGTTVAIRSPKDIERVERILASEQAKIQTEEIPRMVTVMKNFVLYRWVEIALLVAGLALFLSFPPMSLWRGIGAGLGIQSALMLALDFLPKAAAKFTCSGCREW